MPYGFYYSIDNMKMMNNCTCENDCVLLTLTNDIQILNDIILNESLDAGDYIAKLPDFATPNEDIYILCTTHSKTFTELCITTDGYIQLTEALDSDTQLCLNGVSYHIANKYFNAGIGNNFNNWGGQLENQNG